MLAVAVIAVTIGVVLGLLGATPAPIIANTAQHIRSSNRFTQFHNTASRKEKAPTAQARSLIYRNVGD